ncbi:hypothetical protein H072_11511 [Dactylellina haptotyla CBS 200.50]|uniref:Uncharacterized protein n=1 Tax=Dactylellina haptotyla (strain CBS 200.50) TaxID=1284197 RepID=S7ZWI7_DACHA|nr:hypothetical protein H072_11511 [Dactylellina haptotyla CBS 200.50]
MRSVLSTSLILLSGVSTVLALPLNVRTLPTITWGACADGNYTRVQCGTMQVPIDYNNPNGPKTTLGMARLKSTSANPPLGVLLMNPGGPGGVASGVIKMAAGGSQDSVFPLSLQAKYDIIGLDPRGVGLSTHVKCDPAVWNARVNQFPTTQAEYNALVAHTQAVGASCASLTGNLINFLSSMDVVKDIEVLRQVLTAGKSGSLTKLNFLAWSYGTQLAVQYAELFPTNVGRFVLDGVVDHSLPETAALVGEATAFESTLMQFFAWCKTVSSGDCPIQSEPDLPAFFKNLVDTMNASPVMTSGCTSATCYPVDGSDILAGVAGPLTGTDSSGGWQYLAMILQSASTGDYSDFVANKQTSNSWGGYAGQAIGCQDWLHQSASFSDVQAKMRMAASIAPLTKGFSQSYSYQVACIGWPTAVTNPQHPLKPAALTAPPMLIVTAIYDPSTSISWATGVAASLPQSVLLTRNGWGHTSYPNNGDAQATIVNYLITGTLPARGTIVNS